MLTLLAAPSRSSDNVFEIVTSLFSRADLLAHPQEAMGHLQNLSVVWAVVFLAAGIVTLWNGFRFYKTVTVMMAALIGLFAGYYLGARIGAEYIVAGCLCVLLAVGCFPLMKYAVAVMGGLAGAFIGANIWSALAQIDGKPSAAADIYWVGALIGLIVCGMLAFILFKLSVVLFTSVSGSLIAVLGAMALVLQVGSWRDSVTSSISASAMVLPLLVFVPAILGLILQETQGGKPEVAPKKAAA